MAGQQKAKVLVLEQVPMIKRHDIKNRGKEGNNKNNNIGSRKKVGEMQRLKDMTGPVYHAEAAGDMIVSTVHQKE